MTRSLSAWPPQVADRLVFSRQGRFSAGLACSLAAVCFLAAGAWMSAAAAETFERTLTHYDSRAVQVPATVVLPQVDPQRPLPWVIMAHGHGGNRDEAGAFGRVAQALAKSGIASIRMDFPGCGESTEPFTQNHLGTMLEDISAARRFIVARWPVDTARIGILGYSMGGRLAVLASERDAYQAMALWAPVGRDGGAGMWEFLGGAQRWQALFDDARERGSATFNTPWGQQQELSLDWFAQLENSRPRSVIAKFTGSVLLMHGADDGDVPPDNSQTLAESAVRAVSVESVLLDGAQHGLGFYSDNDLIADQVVSQTARFFRATLANSLSDADSTP